MCFLTQLGKKLPNSVENRRSACYSYHKPQSSIYESSGGVSLAISYMKLWHILLDKQMKKRDLQRAADLSDYTIKKLTRNENVSAEVLGKISRILNCPIDDFVEFTDN